MAKKYKIICSILCILLVVAFIYISNKSFTDEKLVSGVYNHPFKDYVVFYPQHQDDEVLWGGSAIVKAIKECGKDNVYVVLVSDGSGVNTFKNKQYRKLSRKEKLEIRNNEFRAALKDLGIKKENIIILADIDKHEGAHFELMKKVALKFEKDLKSVTHVSHCYKYDNHPMHRKNGKVMHELYLKGEIKETMYFLKPKYASKVQSNQRAIYISNDDISYRRVKDACMEYKLLDLSNHRHGIGYTSAQRYFDRLLEDPYLTSILYMPK